MKGRSNATWPLTITKSHTVLRVFAGNFGGGLLGMLDLPVLPPAAAEPLRTSTGSASCPLKIGREPVSAYRLETVVLGRRF